MCISEGILHHGTAPISQRYFTTELHGSKNFVNRSHSSMPRTSGSKRSLEKEKEKNSCCKFQVSQCCSLDKWLSVCASFMVVCKSMAENEVSFIARSINDLKMGMKQKRK